MSKWYEHIKALNSAFEQIFFEDISKQGSGFFPMFFKSSEKSVHNENYDSPDENA